MIEIFFITISGFDPYWDYKPPHTYTSDKISNFSITKKIYLKCDVIDGSIVDSLGQPTLFSFILRKPAGYKVFCEPETKHFKKRKKSILKTITFYLEIDKNEGVSFNGETLTFTLQFIMNRTIKRVFRNLKVILFVFEGDIDLLQKIFLVI